MKVREMSKKTSPDFITNLIFVSYLFSNVFKFVNIFKHILSSSYKNGFVTGFVIVQMKTLPDEFLR